MICKICGSEIPDNSKFCQCCGSMIEDVGKPAENANSNQTQVPKPTVTIPVSTSAPILEPVKLDTNSARVEKKGNSGLPLKYLLLAMVPAALVFITVISIVIYNMNKSIDLSKYVEVSFEGYEGRGTAEWSFNQTAFSKDYGDKLKFNEKKFDKWVEEEGEDPDSWKIEDMKDDLKAKKVQKLTTGELSQDENLSNGDKITFAWDLTGEEEFNSKGFYNYKFKCSEKDFTVEGLEDIQVIDAFQGVEVIFEGMAPYGKATVDASHAPSSCDILYYDIDKYYDLSNGDTVTVTIETSYKNNEDYIAENYGVIVQDTTKTFVVEGLGQYVTKLDEIPDNMKESMKQQGLDVFNSRATKWNEHVSVKNVELEGYYLLTPKGDSSTKNKLVEVFKVDIAVDCTDTDVHDRFSYYYPIAFYNMITLPDGTFSVDLSDYNTAGNSFKKSYDFGGWWDADLSWDGYEKKDTLFNREVTANIEYYNYESTIE